MTITPTTPEIEIKKGKNLPEKYIRRFNEIMKEAWEEDKPLRPGNRKPYAEDLFFIVFDKKKEILSIGRLRPVKIKFMGKIYSILGLADLVSVVKRKGYGKKIMTAMRKHLIKNKKTGIGFCEHKNVGFYRKCKFKIAKGQLKRFVYKTPKGKIIRDTSDDEVVYLEGKDNLMKEIISHPKEKIWLKILFW